MKFAYPKPVEAVRQIEPVPVRFVWRVSATVDETWEGEAVAWSRGKGQRACVLVRFQTGGRTSEGWVWAEDVTRLEGERSDGPDGQGAPL